MSPESAVRPGDFAKVSLSHASRFAGRTGLVVAVDGDVAKLRFGAVRVTTVALADLRRTVGRGAVVGRSHSHRKAGPGHRQRAVKPPPPRTKTAQERRKD